MRCQYSCGTEEHALSRRTFLRGAAGGGTSAPATVAGIVSGSDGGRTCAWARLSPVSFMGCWGKFE